MVDGNTEDLWQMTLDERELVMTKNRANRLGFAILLTFFRERGRFPRNETEVEAQGIAALSKQLGVPVPIDGETFLAGRTTERLRAEIRMRFGFREVTVADAEMLTEWLRDHVAGEVGGKIEPNELDATQKSVIANIVGLIGAGAGASTGNTASAVTGGMVAHNAVENNYLTKSKLDEVEPA